MSVEALLAVLSAGAGIALVIGLPRIVSTDMRWLEVRLRRYGARPFELSDEEQKQAASVQVTQLLANRLEASVSGRTFAATLQTELARANVRLTVGEFLILQVSLASELHVLAHQLDRLSEKNRWSRDFTLNSLRHALREIIACFPVYRTYVVPTRDEISEDDVRYVDDAVTLAKSNRSDIDPELFESPN